MSLSNIPLLFLYFITPESPRWLLGKQRYKQAEKILIKGSQINANQDLPADVFKDIKKEDSENQDEISMSFTKLFLSHSRFRNYLLSMCLLWFAHGFVYYGLGLNTGSLGGDVFVNTIIFGAVDLPAYAACVLALTYLR